MPKSSFVDFKAVKATITMEQILLHYGLMDQFKRSGDNLNGPCPIHKGSSPTQFRVSTSKNIWHCFSECKRGGNTLDFIAKMENVSIHAAALKAIEWFQLNPEAVLATSDEEHSTEPAVADAASPPKSVQRQPEAAAEKSSSNTPLKFRLDKLEREHPYLIQERGLKLETIVDFGMGFCAKGVMAGRIAIPIHNPEGNVVAYAGRWPGKSEGETPKYKLPQGFRKSLELFNIDRAIKEPAVKPLLIVEGFFDCIKLHQQGYHKVVALMGNTMSAAQEELIKQHTVFNSRIIVMLDENEAGRAGRDDIACRLSKHCFVRVHKFSEEDMGLSSHPADGYDKKTQAADDARQSDGNDVRARRSLEVSGTRCLPGAARQVSSYCGETFPPAGVASPHDALKLARNYDSSLAQKAAIFACPVALNVHE